MYGYYFWVHPNHLLPCRSIKAGNGVRMGSHCWTRQRMTLGSTENHEIGLTCFFLLAVECALRDYCFPESPG